MSYFPRLTQLGLILCILGLVAARPNEENSADIPSEGALVTESLNTIEDNSEEKAIFVGASEENSDTSSSGTIDKLTSSEEKDIFGKNSDTSSSEEEKCKQGGDRCYGRKECCSGRCIYFYGRCDYGGPGPFFSNFL